jgi:hypothetical protein
VKDDGYDHIRQLAARDADRAMGIFRREEPKPPPPPPVVPPSAPPPPRAAPPVVAAPPKETPAPPPTAPSPPPAPTPPPPAPVAATPPAAKDAAPPEPAPPAEEKPKLKRSKKAMQYFGDPDAPKPAAPPPAEAPAAVTPAAAQPASNEPEAAPVALSESPSVEEMARIAYSSPSPSQRIELMQRLNGIKMSAVVQSLRHNAQSPHPGVRAVAEAQLASIFGANWNRMKPIPKPVQPPRSDDKGGGW